jgi:hypothetical protein
MDRNELQLDPPYLGVPIGCARNAFRARGTFGTNRAPIMHLDLHYLQTDRNELSLDARHLGVPLGASKMIFEPMVRSV